MQVSEIPLSTIARLYTMQVTLCLKQLYIAIQRAQLGDSEVDSPAHSQQVLSTVVLINDSGRSRKFQTCTTPSTVMTFLQEAGQRDLKMYLEASQPLPCCLAAMLCILAQS